MTKQLLNSVIAKYRNLSSTIEFGFRTGTKNSADLGRCYPPQPSAQVDIALLDLKNSSYPKKAELNNC